ncbi:hypothetical protein BDA99DRAFT_527639 [Phascolomyces articulosus]|uniref:Uncharacterized protein n=1 Tax=Phascolomyces articulosus TaxID=60185 RepID=A0AAD5P7N9_9FUNG|nr:hypothetical protein BDA99DRAFT_527639 [Phascolomyces articulosus]
MSINCFFSINHNDNVSSSSNLIIYNGSMVMYICTYVYGYNCPMVKSLLPQSSSLFKHIIIIILLLLPKFYFLYKPLPPKK